MAFLGSACNLVGLDLDEFFGLEQTTPTRSPDGESSVTATRASTSTPDLSTPTFTFTPTKEGLLAGTVTPFSTAPILNPTPIPSATPSFVGEGFNSISVSGNQILWGICKPGEVKITAYVLEPEVVINVVIFVHLEDTTSDNSTPWSTGDAMNKGRNGKFTYVLDADVIDEHHNYMNAWVVYQLVATDARGTIIGRTPVFDRALTIAPCA